MEQFISVLKKNKFPLEGCFSWEIKEVERSAGLQLPHDYKDFLAAMGKSAGRFMIGSAAFYPEILSLREGTLELLAENNLSADLLPDDAFPFYMHQGYQVAYFHAAPNPDKRIYFYSEGEDMKEFVVVADSFVEYWWMYLKGYHKIDKPKRK